MKKQLHHLVKPVDTTKVVLYARGLLIISMFALSIGQANAQAKLFKGKVIDSATNQPLDGVTISLKNTSVGTISDADGNFKINVSDGAILQISMINYRNIIVQARFDRPLVIGLTAINKALSEVVVVGYGTAKRSDITGSVSSVPKDRLSDIPVGNVLSAIEGTVAGVNITSGTNVPGASPAILVRGVNTINGQTNPLVVLDGVPYDNLSLNDINTNDIAAVDILKDVSATAIYGTRGANGVILITTKKGKTGKASISFNTYAGTEGFTHQVNPMGPAEYVQKYADFKEEAGVTNNFPVPNLYEQQNYAAGKTVNWVDQISQPGFINDNTLSVSGGSPDVKYYLSGDYFDEKGVIKGYQNKRGSLRANIDATITSYLTAGANLNFVSSNQDGGRASLQMANEISPYGRLRDPDGTYTIFPMQQEEAFTNPLLGTLTDRNYGRKNVISNVYAEIKPVAGLKYRISASYNYQPTLFQDYTGRNADDIAGGTAEVQNASYQSWVIENLLTYETNWKKNHLDITGLYSAQKNTEFDNSTIANGFINDALSFDDLQGATTFSAASSKVITTMASQMLRVNYSFDSEYLITATARRDGYSAFGNNTSKYGMFPSLALAWNISNEGFMKNVSVVNSLKLRASYGISGNQSAVTPGSTITNFITTTIPSNGAATTGVIANILGNSDLKWESTYGANFGIDFSLFNNRVSGSVDAYDTRTKNLVLYRTLPAATGYLNVVSNVGKVSNQGVELSLTTKNVVSDNGFRWETSFNFAANKNKIIDLYGNKQSDIGNQLFIGQPVSVIYDYKKTGIWQTGQDPSKQDPTAVPGDIKFADLNHNGVIDAGDKTIQGQTVPKWTGGLTSAWQYKSFRLSVLIQTVQGVTKDNNLINFVDVAGRENLPSGVGYWTPQNNNNTRPSLTYTNYLNYGYAQNASFTRIKDATLSYSMPKSITDRLKINALSIYFTGRNLYTFTKWTGYDPEAAYQITGDTENNYPLVRSFILGANITLR
ncbi:TonB-dependent receptor [uncultured Mucilaginibacter sp.]|uniref:SusC/RagA family TonB-linked outer membrane protein n=1 Tax=uncultured Mucilaginibacter sp. TaxID=797541 RepID=UPI0025F6BF0E|nr:TonB-dependent receptor [uncultured Mucilaginibacter sp.]